MPSTRILTSSLLGNELKFFTSRSSGPGGQNVNKVNTKITLRWNVKDSALLAPEEKELLLNRISNQLTVDGKLLITSQDKRSQLQNRQEVLIKLERMLKKAFAKRKQRKPTKPSKSSVQTRLDKKKKQSDKKRWRQNRL